MELAGGCPVCSESSRSLKKFERQLFEERRWNLSQREYCIQLQQEMQKDKDLWQRQENKLREDLKDLNNKIEDLYRTIQDQHKQKAHLEYKNEVLEDQKQELQDKIILLQDKVKHLCAEMSTAQYRARILEEKLTTTTKLLEESHKLKARISQAEGQKSRLEMKVNRLQEEKKQLQAELNHMRDDNCQMQMQLIEQQQKLSSLVAEAPQMQVNQALVKASDSFLDSDCLSDSNGGCREHSDFVVHEDNCAPFNELQIIKKEIGYQDRNSTEIQNNCVLKWHQQTAVHNGGAAAIHQLTEICTLTPIEVADSATQCYDVELDILENCVEENAIKSSYSTTKGDQMNVSLNKETNVCDTSELHNSNICFSCGNEIHMNFHKEDFENNTNSNQITTVSENVGNLRKNAIKNSIGCTWKYGDENGTEMPIYLNAANETHMTFTDKAENFNINTLKEASLCKTVFCVNSGKDNSSGIEPKSFAASGDEVRWNTLQTFPHEQAEDMKKGPESAFNYEENQADMETLHASSSFCGEYLSQLEECCNAISEETEESKDKDANNLIHSTRESKNVQYTTEINSNGSANSEIVPEYISDFGTAEMEESNHTDNSFAHTEDLLKNRKSNEPKEENPVIESKRLKSEASKTNSQDSVITLEKEELKENVTNKDKESLNMLNKMAANRQNNNLMNKKTKSYNSKCSKAENEAKLNEISEEDILDLEKCSQSTFLINNEGSSNSEDSSKRASPRDNGLNKLRGKLSNFNKRGKSKGNAPYCKENNHSKSPNESLSNNDNSNNYKNDNNANDLMNNTNINVCSGNVQTESEMLNYSATLQCETNKEGPLKCEKDSETAYKEACSSSRKTEEKLNASRQNSNETDNNVIKQRMVPQSTKNIQSENTIQQISLNKPTGTIDNNPVYKHSTALCSKYGCNYTALNKNKKVTAVHKRTTSLRNRIILNESEILSSTVNTNTKNNVTENSLTCKKNTLKSDRNSQTQSGVQSVSLSKNKNTDDSIRCQKNASECNRNALSENEIALSKGTVAKLTYNKNVLQCNKEIQSENGVQSSILHKNSNNHFGNYTHQNTSQNANGIPPIAFCKKNKIIEEDLLQKTNTSQYNENILNQNKVYLTASNKTSIVNDNLVHKKNKQVYHPNTHTENTTKSTGLHKNSNKVIKGEIAMQSTDNKHNNITDDDLTQKKKMLLDNEHICSENEIYCTALSKSNVDHKLHHKMNTLQQSVSSSNKNNVNDNFEQKKGVSQSKNNIRSKNELQSITTNKNNYTKDDDRQCRKNTTQWNRDIQSNHGIHPIALNKSVIDNYHAYKRNALKRETYEDNKSGIQPITAHKCNGFEIKNNTSNNPQRNEYVQNQNEMKYIALNENEHSAPNNLVFENNKPQCSKGHETDNGSHPLELEVLHETVNTHMINCDTSYSKMCPQRNGYIHNQNEMKLITLNDNTHSAHNDPIIENNKLHCSKSHETDNESHSLELEVLHETANICMVNCNTSSSMICNDAFNSNIKATKTFTQVNSLSSIEEMDLVCAAKEGKFSSVKELLSLGTCPNCVYNGSTALHAAAETGNLCMCKLLLEAGARVDARDSFSGTPLHAAAKCGNLQVGKLLVKWGASVELRDKTGNLASDIAVSNGHMHMYNWLQEQVCFQKL